MVKAVQTSIGPVVPGRTRVRPSKKSKDQHLLKNGYIMPGDTVLVLGVSYDSIQWKPNSNTLKPNKYWNTTASCFEIAGGNNKVIEFLEQNGD